MQGRHRAPRDRQIAAEAAADAIARDKERRRRERAARQTETSEFVAFLTRAIAGYGTRIGDDPAALVHLRDVEQALRDAVNLGCFQANRGESAYSQYDMARILGVSQQAIQKRAKLGEALHVTRLAATGALVRIGDIRRRRAELLAAAEVEDRTGTERERRAV